MNLLKQLLLRRRRYDELSETIREHLDEKIADLMDRDMTREQAEQIARREFGSVTRIEERSREVWQWSWLESILTDLKLILRRLGRSPGFTATVLLTLAIGIGANTAVFSVVNRILLEPLPYPHSHQLVAMRLSAPGAGGLAGPSTGLGLSASMYFTFARNNQSFNSMGIWTTGTANVTGLAQPEQLHTAMVTGGLLETLDVPAAVGRWFTAAEQDPRGARTVMLSYGYWQRAFGGGRDVIGRMLQVDNQPREIVGIMPRGFRIADHDFDLLIPLALDPVNEKLAGFGYDGIARLKPGVTLAQADADVARLIPVWMNSWTNGPGTNPHYYKRWRIAPQLLSLQEQVLGGVGRMLWVVMAMLGVVMLIACANIMNLLMVRAESRQQELSIRAALGAGRARIARELLTESIALALTGGILAIGVAAAGLRLLVAVGPANLPRLSEISLDPRALVFTLALSVLVGLLLGSIPTWKYAREVNALIPGGASRTTTEGRARQRSRNALVIAQTAMALVLLISALLMIRTFAALRHVQPGFSDPVQVQTMSISIPDSLIPDEQMVTRIENEIADKLIATPGVSSVGFAAGVPMDGNDPNADQMAVEGKVYPSGEPPLYLYNYVSPGYFHAMGTPLVSGRDFTWVDLYGLRSKVIVSQSFAKQAWGSAAAAIGKRVRQFSNLPWQQVIGVVADVRVHGVDEAAPTTVYWPAMLMNPYTRPATVEGQRTVTFAIRSKQAGSESFIRQVQQAVWSVNDDLPVAQVRTMEDLYDKSMARTSFTLVMLAIAGSMALLLSIIGIYGVISYSVSQRTREIGIRLALGAQRNTLGWMFVRSALIMTGIGLAVGIVAAALLTQVMRSLLFSINPIDPLTYFTMPLILTAAALLASYLPARRAAAIDPMQALKTE